MELKKLTAKVADYNDRLVGGKASEIKPSHVRKVLEKLRAKEATLEAEIADAKKDEKKHRLERKLGIARAHIERAEWLLGALQQQRTSSDKSRPKS